MSRAERHDAARPLSRWAERLFAVRHGEEGRLAAHGAYLALMIGSCFVLTAFNDAAFLSRYSLDLLPWAFIASALAVAMTAIAVGRVMERLPPERLSVLLPWLLAAALVVSRLLLIVDPPGFGFVLYVAVFALIGISSIVVWNFVRGGFDAREIKRLMPLLGACASVGAALGGLAVRVLTPHLGTDNLLLVAAAGAVGATAAARAAIRRREAPEAVAREAVASEEGGGGFVDSVRLGFGSIARSPLMRLLTVLLVCAVIGKTLVDYQFKTSLKLRFDQDGIAVFLGDFYALTNVLELLGQLLLSAYLMRRFGLRAALGSRFAMLWLLGLATALHPAFWGFVALRLTDAWTNRVWYKPGTSLAFAPIPDRRADRIRLTQEGMIEPLVVVAASLALLVLPARVGLAGLSWILVGVMSLAALAAHRVVHHYRRELARSIENQLLGFGGAVEVAGLVEGSALEALRSQLDGDDPEQARFALRLLAASHSTALEAEVIRCLGHRDATLRAAAAEVASERDTSACREALWRRLAVEEDGGVLGRVLSLLGAAGDLRAVDAAYGLVEDPRLEVRSEALLLLFRLGGLEGILAAAGRLGALRGGDGEQRTTLARLVGRLRIAQLDRTLEELLDDDDPRVRRAALEAARHLDSPRLARRLAPRLGEEGVSAAIEEVMTNLGAGAWPVLSDVLSERLSEVPSASDQAPASWRAAAARVLSMVGDPRAAGQLGEWATDPAPAVRYAALRGLIRHRDRPLPELLERILPVELRALACFAAHGARGEDPLVRRELELRRRMAEERAVLALALRESPAEILNAWDGLRSGDKRLRASALELLDSLAIGLAEKVLLALLDGVGDALQQAAEVLGVAPWSPQELELQAAADPWLGFVLGDPELVPDAARLALARRLAAVPILGRLRLDDLYQLAAAAHLRPLAAGERWLAADSVPRELTVIAAGELRSGRGDHRSAGDTVAAAEALAERPAGHEWRTVGVAEVLTVEVAAIAALCRASAHVAAGVTEGLVAALRTASELEARQRSSAGAAA